MTYKEFLEKYPERTGEGKRFWLAGLSLGSTAVSRLERKVRPILTEYTIYEKVSNWTGWKETKKEFRKISDKTGKVLTTSVSMQYEGSWRGGSIHVFEEDEKELAQKHWEESNYKLAIKSLEEAGKVSKSYLEAFEQFNSEAGDHQIDRDDALAILRI
jgi:hypothetical protein